ncbi:hypothetical protein [Nocardia macrotermitis]|uniref:hypothetical protein n=1 Tax=Nocardia macrotermitis TaxID=2585198 RepID=UPI001294D8E6|nr:hypothetical protein [Nocardia macrotermitis]
MSTCPLPLRSFCWSETVVPSVQDVDGSRACVATATCAPPGLAVVEHLAAQVCALVTENRRLRDRNRLLAIALDDALDRACAHALCCDNEQLLTAAAAHRSSSTVSVHSTAAVDGFAVH